MSNLEKEYFTMLITKKRIIILASILLAFAISVYGYISYLNKLEYELQLALQLEYDLKVENFNNIETLVLDGTIEQTDMFENSDNYIDWDTVPENIYGLITTEFIDGELVTDDVGFYQSQILLTLNIDEEEKIYRTVDIEYSISSVDLEPVIENTVVDYLLLCGTEIEYPTDVTATDCYGQAIEVTIDSNNIDSSAEGVSEFYYIATDDFGHETVITANVIYLNVNIEAIEVNVEDDVTLEIEDFLSFENISGLTAEFTNEDNDFSKIGSYEIPITISNENGDIVEVSATVVVRYKSDNPIISGVSKLEICVGDSVSYKSGVSAIDCYGNSLSISVDNSSVNLNLEGTYNITYSATDDNGNKSSTSTTITVIEIDADYVLGLIDDILDSITTSSMSDYDKAYAAYKWCKNNINYASSGSHSDIYEIAYYGIKGNPGDCYTYYSVLYLMMQQLDIPVVTMERISGTSSNHKWVAINVGNGWYHVDACPNSVTSNTFMFTDTEAAEYTVLQDEKRGTEYHYYDYKEVSITIVA
ncbi:MAG: DUF5011 domain-containing protein [Clostridia bacterium]